MSLPTTLVDGKGRGNKLRINGEGEIGVVVHTHPPRDEETETYPFSQYFTDNGESTGSNDMIVDGSTTPVDFSIDAKDRDIYIKSISVQISDPNARLDRFGNLTALTNGVSFHYINDNIGSVVIQDEIQTNLDFIRLGLGTFAIGTGTDAFKADISGGGGEDTYLPVIDFAQTFGFPYGLRLVANSNDKIIFTVNDALAGLSTFNIKAFGIQFA